MMKSLAVRPVGFLNNLKNDQRPPESFAFPACMTSLMEYLGEDVRWETIYAHDRTYTKRRLNDAILAATGMAFGLLWSREACPSCFDLMQVNDHNATIARGFDYVGYDFEIVENTGTGCNPKDIKRRVVETIDAGRPVLAFGLMGPPECSIVCGYDQGGDTLAGWSHFQSHAPADCEPNGMFHKSDWQKDIWKIVICGNKKEPRREVSEIIRHGISIASTAELSGYDAGAAAYNAWADYVLNPAYESMEEDALRGAYHFHHALVGNHAEARCYLGNFLHDAAGEDMLLHKIAEHYGQIHNLCWQVWAAAGNWNDANAHGAFRQKEKRERMAELIKSMAQLDAMAVEELKKWLKG